MKKSYKLFGTMWDGADSEINCLNNVSVLCARETEAEQVINLTDMLSINSSQEFDNFIQGYNPEKTTCFNIDYSPENDNKTLSIFYNKRVSQILLFLQNIFEDLIIFNSVCQKI